MDKLEIENNKAEFINLLKSTGREGVDELIDMLDDGKMRFFTAPASVNHHLNYDGGLLQHSLNTCQRAENQSATLGLCRRSSIMLTSFWRVSSLP